MRTFAITAAVVMLSPALAAAQGDARCDVPLERRMGVVYGSIHTAPASVPPALSGRSMAFILEDIARSMSDTIAIGPAMEHPAVMVTGRNRRQMASLTPAFSGNPDLESEVTFLLTRGGELKRPRLTGKGAAPIDERLLAAVKTAASPEQRPPFSTSGDWDTLELTLRLALAPDPTALITMPFAVAVQDVPPPPHALPRQVQLPDYPRTLQSAGTGGEVIYWVNVDARGRPDPASFGVARLPTFDLLQAEAYTKFAATAREAVTSWNFTPAQPNGCAISQRVVGRMRFQLR